MNAISQIEAVPTAPLNAYEWLAKVLTSFAVAEQALGRLCIAAGIPITNGSLSNLSQLRQLLIKSENRRCGNLDKRIERWVINRPVRHLLAHATLYHLTDEAGNEIVVTRHLPRDITDVTPDRMWTVEDRKEILRQANNDGRSIADHVRNIMANHKLVGMLRDP